METLDALKEKIGTEHNKSPTSIISTILESNKKWNLVEKYIVKIMKFKEGNCDKSKKPYCYQ